MSQPHIKQVTDPTNLDLDIGTVVEDKAGKVYIFDKDGARRAVTFPAATEPKILYTSDTHLVDPPTEAVFAALASEQPDLCLLGGDIGDLDGGEAEIQAVMDMLALHPGLSDRVWTAWGNHDLGASSIVDGRYGVPLARAFPHILAIRGSTLATTSTYKYYYVVHCGPVDFFVVDSGYDNILDRREPDGVAYSSVQGQWIRAALADSRAPWKIVVFHIPPYCSDISRGYGDAELRWPFKDWGADLVLNGHGHNYERVVVDDFTYMVVGTGGGTLRGFKTPPVTGSAYRLSEYGYLRIEATATELTTTFVGLTSGEVDEQTFTK